MNATFENMGFAGQVWVVCEPAYAEPSKGGARGSSGDLFQDARHGSLRGLAQRAGHCHPMRGQHFVLRYLGDSLTEAMPDHSLLRVIGERLSLEHLEVIHSVLLAVLHAPGLLKERKLGIDSSVVDANVSMRALEQRNPEES